MNKKILIVDDDIGILEVLQLALERMGGHSVLVADTMEKTYEMIEKKPDLILLDYLMFGKNGKEITQELKENHQTRNIPIIMSSGYPHIGPEVLAAGADDFIAKPFNIEDLLQKIETHTRRV